MITIFFRKCSENVPYIVWKICFKSFLFLKKKLSFLIIDIIFFIVFSSDLCEYYNNHLLKVWDICLKNYREYRFLVVFVRLLF